MEEVSLVINNISIKYKFPEYYDWPFFYTIQKHAETRIKQLTMWAELIANFCRENKIWRLSKSDFMKSVAKNTKINRYLIIDYKKNIIFYIENCPMKLLI